MVLAPARRDHPAVPFVCPVCGYPDLEDPPRGASGAGSLEICPSCGFQFGKSDDDDGWSYAAWRERWVADGMPWDRGSSEPPEGWDPQAQLRTVLSEGERGQTFVEYLAVIAIIVVLVGGLVKAAPSIASDIDSTLCAVIGSGCGGGSGGGPAGGPATQAPGTGGIGGVVAGAGGSTSNPLGEQVETAASDAQALRDAGGNAWGRPSTLARHFRDHGGDFGATDPEDYAQRAQDFFQRAVSERLPTKVDSDGTIRVYDPATNEFGSYNADGTTKTYYKPTRGQDYWDEQPGTDPWAEPPGGGEPPNGGEPPGGEEAPAGEEPPAGGEPPAPEVPEVPEVPEMPEIPELPFPEIPIIIP
jgi:hypothetical protein